MRESTFNPHRGWRKLPGMAREKMQRARAGERNVGADNRGHRAARLDPTPHKEYSDLYEKMSGKGERASEAHQFCMTIGHTNSTVFGFAFAQLSGSGALVVKPTAAGPVDPLTIQGEKRGSAFSDLQSQC